MSLRAKLFRVKGTKYAKLLYNRGLIALIGLIGRICLMTAAVFVNGGAAACGKLWCGQYSVYRNIYL